MAQHLQTCLNQLDDEPVTPDMAAFRQHLKKRHGYGPRTTAADADYAFRHLDGYNRDPALVLPPLRWLLPAYAAVINEDATVIVAGRRYHDDLLRYWTGAPVTVRVSRHDPHLAYIYLDGEILCQAAQAA